MAKGSLLHCFVHDHLDHRRWTPAQIAQRLRRMKPDEPSARVSHETIYATIYAQPRGGLKVAMIATHCGRQSPRAAAGARRWRAVP